MGLTLTMEFPVLQIWLYKVVCRSVAEHCGVESGCRHKWELNLLFFFFFLRFLFVFLINIKAMETTNDSDIKHIVYETATKACKMHCYSFFLCVFLPSTCIDLRIVQNLGTEEVLCSHSQPIICKISFSLCFVLTIHLTPHPPFLCFPVLLPRHTCSRVKGRGWFRLSCSVRPSAKGEECLYCGWRPCGLSLLYCGRICERLILIKGLSCLSLSIDGQFLQLPWLC